jgi:trans-aconitate 2-methyltransferase
MDAWNPAQYNKFQAQRAQPFWDLAAKIDFSRVKNLLDIGCGTGETTHALHGRQKIPRSLGIDSSAQMLDKTRALSGAGLEFQLAQAEDYRPSESFDVILSNAALQWVPGHAELFPRIFGWLAPGGQLAIQMPVNADHPSHRLADELALELGLRLRQPPVLKPEDYARIFYDHGLEQIDISIKVYLHPMPSVTAIAEWTKGTLLTHYQKQLSEADYGKFLTEYTRRLIQASGGGDGPCLYTFKRLFLVAVNSKTPA